MTDEECARLILETVPKAMRVIRTEMRKSGSDEFTIPQLRILAKISRAPSSNSELAEWMGVRAPTMSKMIDKLVKRGHVTRKANSPDRRQVILKCTKKGMDRANEIRGVVQKMLADKIAGLSAEKRDSLTGGLSVLKELFV